MQFKTNALAIGDNLLYNDVDLKSAFKHRILDDKGHQLRFDDLFDSRKAADALSRSPSQSSNSTAQSNEPTSIYGSSCSRKVLIIFIRHFFCGNCQEYLRRLASHPFFTDSSLLEHNIGLNIIGCGASSLIESYRMVTGIPNAWRLYADPLTELYRLLGMQRTYSMGKQGPRYIQRTLTGNMLRSVAQGLRRIPDGDVLGAGRWNVNGGEFLFEPQNHGAGTSSANSWKVTWCHRMLNSRDHTEVENLLAAVGLTASESNQNTATAKGPRLHTRSLSTPLLSQGFSLPTKKVQAPAVKHTSSLRKSLSIRRQSWMNRTGGLSKGMNA